MPEKMVLSYSCELHFPDKDNWHQPITKITLSENITTAELARLVKMKNFTMGKIVLTKTSNTTKQNITLYVDNKVRTASEVSDMLKKKYQTVPYGIPGNKRVPVVVVGHRLVSCDARTLSGTIEETKQKHYADIHPLRPDTDILVDPDFKEIWPKNTGTVPEIIKEFFENER